MKLTSMSTLRLAAAASAVVWTMAFASPAGGQVPDPADADGDGVADAVDQCPDTEPMELVDGDGCSVCPCDETANGDDWASHDEYVSCVSDEVKARHVAGTMKRREMRNAVRRARKASCGNPAITRCCVYVHLDDTADVNMGQCRMMSPDDCDALNDRVDWAEDVGGGNCAPNPCEF